ncbi:uncharacterized protein YecT (DUF1311 family) [Lysinibacillus sp. RC46]
MMNINKYWIFAGSVIFVITCIGIAFVFSSDSKENIKEEAPTKEKTTIEKEAIVEPTVEEIKTLLAVITKSIFEISGEMDAKYDVARIGMNEEIYKEMTPTLRQYVTKQFVEGKLKTTIYGLCYGCENTFLPGAPLYTKIEVKTKGINHIQVIADIDDVISDFVREDISELMYEDGAWKLHDYIRGNKIVEKSVEEKTVPEEVQAIETTNPYKQKLINVENLVATYTKGNSGVTSDILEELNQKYIAWDNLLNELYGDIKMSIPTEEFNELRLVQRKWIKERDLAVEEAGLENEGGAMESIDKASKLVEYTRARSYEFVKLYLSKNEERTSTKQAPIVTTNFDKYVGEWKSNSNVVENGGMSLNFSIKDNQYIVNVFEYTQKSRQIDDYSVTVSLNNQGYAEFSFHDGYADAPGSGTIQLKDNKIMLTRTVNGEGLTSFDGTREYTLTR